MIDTWEWTDENGKIQREQIEYYIEWESCGADSPIKLMEARFCPTSYDEVCPPPAENAILMDHKFEGWISDGVLWFRQRLVSNYKEFPLGKMDQYVFHEKTN